MIPLCGITNRCGERLALQVVVLLHEAAFAASG